MVRACADQNRLPREQTHSSTTDPLLPPPIYKCPLLCVPSATALKCSLLTLILLGWPCLGGSHTSLCSACSRYGCGRLAHYGNRMLVCPCLTWLTSSPDSLSKRCVVKHSWPKLSSVTHFCQGLQSAFALPLPHRRNRMEKPRYQTVWALVCSRPG